MDLKSTLTLILRRGRLRRGTRRTLEHRHVKRQRPVPRGKQSVRDSKWIVVGLQTFQLAFGSSGVLAGTLVVESLAIRDSEPSQRIVRIERCR